MNARKLPQAIEIEESVIVSILIEPEDRLKAFEKLSKDDFYSTANQIIFSRCKQLQGNGGSINATDIYSALTDDDKKFVKADYLFSLIDNVPLAINIESSIKRLKDAARHRRAIELANAIAKNAYKSNSEAIERLVQQLVIETREPKTEPKESKSSGAAFPYQPMTGAAGFFTNVYADVIEAPSSFLFMSYLTCLGAVVSKKLSLKTALATQPRLDTVLVGESSIDRKSTSLNLVTNHYKNAVSDFTPCWGVGSAEGLQKLLKKSEGDDKPGLLLVQDELKQLVNKCKIEGSVLLPCINTLFESNRYHGHTKTKSIEIDNAHLSLLAACTLETYETIYNSAFTAIGFPNRVFLVIGTAKRQHSIPEKISEIDSVEMEEKLIKILKHVGNGLELDITPDAREYYQQWYMDMEKSVHARRLDTYSLRLMMLLAVNNLKNIIDLETTMHATMLCDWQLEIRKMYDPIDCDNKISAMEERIRRHLRGGPLTKRELKQKCSYHKHGIWVFDTGLKNLERAGEVGYSKINKVFNLME